MQLYWFFLILRILVRSLLGTELDDDREQDKQA